MFFSYLLEDLPFSESDELLLEDELPDEGLDSDLLTLRDSLLTEVSGLDADLLAATEPEDFSDLCIAGAEDRREF